MAKDVSETQIRMNDVESVEACVWREILSLCVFWEKKAR